MGFIINYPLIWSFQNFRKLIPVVKELIIFIRNSPCYILVCRLNASIKIPVCCPSKRNLLLSNLSENTFLNGSLLITPNLCFHRPKFEHPCLMKFASKFVLNATNLCFPWLKNEHPWLWNLLQFNKFCGSNGIMLR